MAEPSQSDRAAVRTAVRTCGAARLLHIQPVETGLSMTSPSVKPDPTSRRRQRLSTSPSSSATDAKRPRFADSPAMATARARGKLPETVDLTERPSAFKPYTGSKKLVIKNLRAPVNREAQVEEYYSRTESDLQEALDAIFDNRRPSVPLERLYRGVEDVCRRGNAAKVYKLLKERMESHLQLTLLPRIKRKGGLGDIGVLRAVLEEWKAWNTQTVRLWLVQR